MSISLERIGKPWSSLDKEACQITSPFKKDRLFLIYSKKQPSLLLNVEVFWQASESSLSRTSMGKARFKNYFKVSFKLSYIRLKCDDGHFEFWRHPSIQSNPSIHPSIYQAKSTKNQADAFCSHAFKVYGLCRLHLFLIIVSESISLGKLIANADLLPTYRERGCNAIVLMLSCSA